ncbi:DUF2802 domain-containing protein [Alteromonas oceanisediminis]|uniref:DUF2802 domain-containing protein n=1 Tax=Alteromonas oceanisediminis TaxID=2836180 RepID=UPI001BD9BCB9|nr:DUF2802 domain-containing protein [Alteromonas oceanisediminis]MBT0584895.1 DUF2802 domain-containing protein [Alteromonas oceanisediminis]
MAEWLVYIALAVSVLALLLISGLALRLRSRQHALAEALNDLDHRLSEHVRNATQTHDTLLRQLRQQRLEQSEVHQHINHQIDSLTNQYQAIEQSVRDIQLHDPEIKLYQQAKQMVAAGASVDEVVETCGIPRAEAELLRSLQTAR